MATVNIERMVRESEKAYLVVIKGIQLWIPKSICRIPPMDSTVIEVEDWFLKKTENVGAIFSDDKKHRLFLWRYWSDRKHALCIGLNPSTATVNTNDQTIGRLSKYLSTMGYGGFRMVNLFTIISSDPTILLTDEVKGDIEHDMGMIFANSLLCQEIIFCWGAFPEARDRAQKVMDFYTDAKCFGKTKKGEPWHPLACFYAGLKESDVRLFDFKTHDHLQNHSNVKRRKKVTEHSYSQIPLTLT